MLTAMWNMRSPGCEVSERSLKTLLAPFAVLNLDSMVLVAGAEESAVVNKMSELIRTLCI